MPIPFSGGLWDCCSRFLKRVHPLTNFRNMEGRWSPNTHKFFDKVSSTIFVWKLEFGQSRWILYLSPSSFPCLPVVILNILWRNIGSLSLYVNGTTNYLHNWLAVSTHLKNISQNGSSPQVGVDIKNLWNHHLVKYFEAWRSCEEKTSPAEAYGFCFASLME